MTSRRFFAVAAVAALAAAASPSAHAATGTETTLLDFVAPGSTPDLGYNPQFKVLIAGNGVMYGVAVNGGKFLGGTVYRLNGTKPTVLYNFNPKYSANFPCGYMPSSGLIMDSSGALYGSTSTGGKNGGGTIYKLSLPIKNGQWTCTVLHDFTSSGPGINQGFAPYGGLLKASDGTLYGTTTQGGNATRVRGNYMTGGVVFALKPSGGTYTYSVVYKFAVTGNDRVIGFSPAGPLVFGPGGAMYGATFFGGLNNGGAIYKLTPNGAGWKASLVHHFNAGTSTNPVPAESGYQPTQGALLFDVAGNIYGATTSGGCPAGSTTCTGKQAVTPAGVIYKLTPGGKYTVLRTFDKSQPLYQSGYGAYGGLIMDKASGLIYGVTQFGGRPSNAGVLFKMNTNGGYGIVYRFGNQQTNGADGIKPGGPPTLDSKGNLVGVTLTGGKNNLGALYSIKP
jgi:uncharacterized repeat protein (TIGR03803 family)